MKQFKGITNSLLTKNLALFSKSINNQESSCDKGAKEIWNWNNVRGVECNAAEQLHTLIAVNHLMKVRAPSRPALPAPLSVTPHVSGR
ncbi:unnamed protein product [Pieris brassicae]|uniref:Uncharacterized protein n=1 Tax=Pieris brassicae TaxID=7116 RepID=A0A9P0TM57_PIEBR|nr:unnamed protein product [Pieris brassicae]